MEKDQEKKIEIKGDVGQINTGDIEHQYNYTVIKNSVSITVNMVSDVLKKLHNDPCTDNVSDISGYEFVIAQREIDLRIGMLVFMCLSAACLFAFWYPSLWKDLAIAGSLDVIALIIASGFVMKAVDIVRHKEYVGSLIQQNLINRELKKLSGD